MWWGDIFTMPYIHTKKRGHWKSFFVYNLQLLNWKDSNIFVGNGKFFCFDYGSKLDIDYIFIKKLLFKKNQFVFVEFTGFNCNRKYANGLCVSILVKNMGWYLEVI